MYSCMIAAGEESNMLFRKIGCIQHQESSAVPKSLFHTPLFRTITIPSVSTVFFILPFILSTSSKETVSAGKEKCKCLPCPLFLQGQNGRGVNEWQSVLISRRGYLGLAGLISPNAFQFLMLPNCRLHQAGPFIIARQSSASNETGTTSPELCGRIYQAGLQFITVWVFSDHTHLLFCAT